jgi:hypothetical protein
MCSPTILRLSSTMFVNASSIVMIKLSEDHQKCALSVCSDASTIPWGLSEDERANLLAWLESQAIDCTPNGAVSTLIYSHQSH